MCTVGVGCREHKVQGTGSVCFKITSGGTVRENTDYILPVFFLVHIQKVDGVSIDVSPEQLVRLWLIEWTLTYFSLGII